MIIEHLPWESVDGPKYYPKELKPRKKWVTRGGWCMSVFLIVCGLITSYYLVAIFGLLYMLALMMKKDTVITTRGLEIYYQMRITTHYDFWSWDEINSIVREAGSHPELVALHIGIGNREKGLFFTKADAEKILKLAAERNPAIKVMDSVKSDRNSGSKPHAKKKK